MYIDSTSKYQKRREMFKSVGDALVSSLSKTSRGNTDSTVQGNAGNSGFRKWLKEQLPRRYKVYGGTVLSQKHDPLTERDCLIFDAIDYAPFRASGKPDVFPIEGVTAATS